MLSHRVQLGIDGYVLGIGDGVQKEKRLFIC
jgi:hypothetical protein